MLSYAMLRERFEECKSASSISSSCGDRIRRSFDMADEQPRSMNEKAMYGLELKEYNEGSRKERGARESIVKQ